MQDSQRWLTIQSTQEFEMNRFKLVGVMLGVLFALAAMATSASAFTLPDVSVTLTGGTYPLHLEANNPAAKTFLESASGVGLEGTGVSTLLLATELSALGTFASLFLGVILAANHAKCHTGNNAAGVVSVGGEYHIVPLNNKGKIGLLFLVSEFQILCGEPTEATITIRGDTLGSITNAGTENQELTSLTGALLGSLGKPELSEYINDTGSIIKAKLESDAGLEFVAANEDINEPNTFLVLGSQMLVITGR
jgi:hypothetical protein